MCVSLQSKLASERLNIPQVYHPFICGPDNEHVKNLQERTSVRINIPPPTVHKDEVVVSGEKEGVAAAVANIMAIYEEKVCRLFGLGYFSMIASVPVLLTII